MLASLSQRRYTLEVVWASFSVSVIGSIFSYFFGLFAFVFWVTGFQAALENISVFFFAPYIATPSMYLFV